MYARPPSLILGFHGCDEEIGLAVLAGEAELTPSQNDYDWLGSGCYFWENDAERALEFAREMQGRERRSGKPISKPFVIGAIIDLGHCLNLLERQGLALVQAEYTSMTEAMAEFGLEVPKNRPLRGTKDLVFRRLDRAVIESVHAANKRANLPEYDSVRAVFVEGDPLYPGAGFHSKNHIQICVRKHERILGYFRPRKRIASS
jgi:hypothetical protein